jgi:hypothetical protein
MSEKNETLSHTSIHTHIDGTKRISSIWRRYTGAFEPTWEWETLVWEGERIIHQAQTVRDVRDVIAIHSQLFDKITNGEDLEDSHE